MEELDVGEGPFLVTRAGPLSRLTVPDTITRHGRIIEPVCSHITFAEAGVLETPTLGPAAPPRICGRASTPWLRIEMLLPSSEALSQTLTISVALVAV